MDHWRNDKWPESPVTLRQFYTDVIMFISVKLFLIYIGVIRGELIQLSCTTLRIQRWMEKWDCKLTWSTKHECPFIANPTFLLLFLLFFLKRTNYKVKFHPDFSLSQFCCPNSEQKINKIKMWPSQLDLYIIKQ